MYKSITLPDNISFDEIAVKWCEHRDDDDYAGYLSFNKDSDGIKITFGIHTYWEEDFTECIPIAWFVINERKFKIDDDYEEKFQPILDFIKERSNG